MRNSSAAMLAVVHTLVTGAVAVAADDDPALPPWPSTCRQTETAPGGTVCTVAQDIVGRQGQMLFRIAFQVQSWQDNVLLHIRAPLMLYLPKGLSYGVDQGALDDLSFERCGPAGCDAFAVVDDAALKSILAGEQLNLTVWRDAATSQQVTVPLARFADSWREMGSASLTGQGAK